MQHFLVEITYTAAPERIGELVAGHRAFLQTGYDQGLLLFSGPQNPKVGGVVLARAETETDLRNFFLNDPYQSENAATYRFVSFEPVKFQPFMEAWVKGDLE